MTYLSKFDTLAAYTTAKSTLTLPHVSYIEADNTVKYDPKTVAAAAEA